jgi:1,4-dihydroxy-2-naphthoyl-CoA synthase
MVSETAGLALANVLYEKKGSVAYVTVNRPKVLNALNTPTWSDLREAFEDARDDAAVRGVVLTGAGDKRSRLSGPVASDRGSWISSKTSASRSSPP